jgi:membrane-bound lytic murein transglycosylase B
MSDRRHLLIGLCGLATGCGAAASPSAEAPRRNVASGPAAGATEHAAAGGGPFDQFLNGVRADARRSGVSQATLQRAFAGLQPNQRIIELDRRQSEAVLTWEEYRERIVSPTRIETGRRNYAEGRGLLERIGARYGVSPRVVVAIWGMETNYGANTGGFGVVEALATLAWEGRRAGYFRGELLSALRILDAGHVAPERMRGSWAGAMGQPQFMPSNFERLAVDFDGDGRRDIWDNRADALGSIAHYLSRHGWRDGRALGLGGAAARPGRGLRRGHEAPAPRMGTPRLPPGGRRAAAVRRGGDGAGAAQPVLREGLPWRAQLRVIRRYNPPVNYGLAVGLLSDRVA